MRLEKIDFICLFKHLKAGLFCGILKISFKKYLKKNLCWIVSDGWNKLFIYFVKSILLNANVYLYIHYLLKNIFTNSFLLGIIIRLFRNKNGKSFFFHILDAA